MGRAFRSTVGGLATATPPSRRGRPVRWTPDRIENELRAFAPGRTDWPPSREFLEAGRADLLRALDRNGGAAVWANRLGLALGTRQMKAPYSVEDAVREAAEVIAQVGRLPNMLELRATGHVRLATLVMYAGGARAFCREHNLLPEPAAEGGAPAAGAQC